MKERYFIYGEKEIAYLRSADARLAAVIDRIGIIRRPVQTDLFTSVIHSIVGQQISTKAQQTIWKRMTDDLSTIDAPTLLSAGTERIQAYGLTFRKAEYILDFARQVQSGQFDPAAVETLPDAEAVRVLSQLKGIGVWTAEMILLFCLQRPDIFSYGDLAILRGMRMVFHHRKITRAMFERYRRKFSPYCSVASLYFWAVAGGAIPEMKDCVPKKKARKQIPAR